MSVKIDPAKERRDRLIFRAATPIGALLLVAGQVGARTGLVTSPGDPHHIATQVIGAALLLWVLSRWR